jgi:phosphate transport system protein
MALRNRLDEVVQQLMQSASLVESMVEKSIKGLVLKEKRFFGEVIGQDEPRENRFEIEIDEACVQLIALFQPAAKDLRTIIMMLKMNNDLERMGDEAVNVCESGLFLIEQPPVKPLIDIPRMAEETVKMVKDSLKSFVDEDAKLAKEVCEHDDIVDALASQILRELITFMASDPTTIERSLQLLRIARSLERIADLSTNICEDVIYMVEGRVIKHHQEE